MLPYQAGSAAVRSSWKNQSGRLVCRWSEPAEHTQYHLYWSNETPDVQSGYLPPLPDFARHSPFGGVSWFESHSNIHDLDELLLVENR